MNVISDTDRGQGTVELEREPLLRQPFNDAKSYVWTSPPDERGKALRVMVDYWKGKGIMVGCCDVLSSSDGCEQIPLSSIRTLKVADCARWKATELRRVAMIVEELLPVTGDAHTVAAELAVKVRDQLAEAAVRAFQAVAPCL